MFLRRSSSRAHGRFQWKPAFQSRIEVEKATVGRFVGIDALRIWRRERVKGGSESLCFIIAVDTSNSYSGNEGRANAGPLRGMFVLALIKRPVQHICQHLPP